MNERIQSVASAMVNNLVEGGVLSPVQAKACRPEIVSGLTDLTLFFKAEKSPVAKKSKKKSS